MKWKEKDLWFSILSRKKQNNTEQSEVHLYSAAHGQ